MTTQQSGTQGPRGQCRAAVSGPLSCLLSERLLQEFQHISSSPWSLQGRWCRGEPLTSPGNQSRPNVVALLWGTVTAGFCFQGFFFCIPHPSLRACGETAHLTVLRQKGREPSAGFLRGDEVTLLPQAQGCRPGPSLPIIPGGTTIHLPQALPVTPSPAFPSAPFLWTTWETNASSCFEAPEWI